MIYDQIDQENFMGPFCSLGLVGRNIEMLMHIFSFCCGINFPAIEK
jgi:hypothetical protein